MSTDSPYFLVMEGWYSDWGTCLPHCGPEFDFFAQYSSKHWVITKCKAGSKPQHYWTWYKNKQTKRIIALNFLVCALFSAKNDLSPIIHFLPFIYTVINLYFYIDDILSQLNFIWINILIFFTSFKQSTQCLKYKVRVFYYSISRIST